MAYQAIYNRQARQWDVVDDSGSIVAMCGGGKRGEAEARRKADNLTFIDSALDTSSKMRAILEGRA